MFTTIAVPGAAGGTQAYGINDAGQIVGVAYDTAVSHSFIAPPVPELASLALLGVGGLLSLGYVRRRRA